MQSVVSARAATVPDRPVVIQGAGLAAAGVAAGRFDPNVDFWPIYSESSIDNDSSHGLSGAIWPGFLLDAFAWLYGLQPQERAGLGISESQWPNAPHTSSACMAHCRRRWASCRRRSGAPCRSRS